MKKRNPYKALYTKSGSTIPFEDWMDKMKGIYQTKRRALPFNLWLVAMVKQAKADYDQKSETGELKKAQVAFRSNKKRRNAEGDEVDDETTEEAPKTDLVPPVKKILGMPKKIAIPVLVIGGALILYGAWKYFKK